MITTLSESLIDEIMEARGYYAWWTYMDDEDVADVLRGTCNPVVRAETGEPR